MKRVISLSLLCVIPTFSYGIIVMTPHDVGEKPGVSGELATSLSASRGNSDSTQTLISAVGYFDSGSSVSTLSGSHTFGESHGVTSADKTFVHARTFIPYKEQQDIGGEIFTQYSRDLFTSLEERELFGVGVRKKFGTDTKNRLYVGLGAMGVREKEKQLGQNSYTSLNIYTNHVATWSDGKKLLSTLYYQPKVEKMDDYLATGTLSLSLPIVGRLFLSGVISVNYDSKPQQGIKATDTTMMTVLKYVF